VSRRGGSARTAEVRRGQRAEQVLRAEQRRGSRRGVARAARCVAGGPSKRLAEQRVQSCKEGLAGPGYLAGLLEKQRGGAAAVKEEEGTALRV
jgi:hypothetical protein